MEKEAEETQKVLREVLTTPEATEYLRTTRQTLIKLVKEGKVKGNKVGRNYRFLKADLDKFIRGE